MDLDQILGLATTGGVAGGGIWLVFHNVIKYQRDFTGRYAKKIIELEARIESIEAEREQLNRDLLACRTERGALRAVVRQAGIPWRPSDWQRD